MTNCRIALVGILIVILLCAACNPFTEIKPTILQSEHPESVEQARRRLGMQLPDSAQNVQYASYREWQAVLELVRFEATVHDCRATAEAIIAEYNAQHRDQIKGLRPLDPTGRDPTQPCPPSSTAPLSAPWFDPRTIRDGLVAGEEGSHKPRIWIDTERGELYYMYTD